MDVVLTVVKKSPSNSKSLEKTNDSAGPSWSSNTSSCVKPPKRYHSDLKHQQISDDAADLDSRVVHKNQPVLISIYKDPATLAERVCVAVTLPSGVKDVTFGLVGSGPASSTARITYSWPEVMFNVEDLFKTKIKGNKMSVTHPIVLSLKSELENNRKNIQEEPRGSIQVTLSIPVQTNTEKIKCKAGQDEDGVLVVVANCLPLIRLTQPNMLICRASLNNSSRFTAIHFHFH